MIYLHGSDERQREIADAIGRRATSEFKSQRLMRTLRARILTGGQNGNDLPPLVMSNMMRLSGSAYSLPPGWPWSLPRHPFAVTDQRRRA